jgi:ssDNA thymidine ADP-ribosyltransferase, DarT
VSSAERVRAAGLAFAFTNGHAAMAVTDYWNDLDALANIDWPLMTSRYWFATLQDPDRKRRRQAEFLVHGEFPWALVDGVAARKPAAVGQVRATLERAGFETRTAVRPEWYY